MIRWLRSHDLVDDLCAHLSGLTLSYISVLAILAGVGCAEVEPPPGPYHQQPAVASTGPAAGPLATVEARSWAMFGRADAPPRLSWVPAEALDCAQGKGWREGNGCYFGMHQGADDSIRVSAEHWWSIAHEHAHSILMRTTGDTLGGYADDPVTGRHTHPWFREGGFVDAAMVALQFPAEE